MNELQIFQNEHFGEVRAVEHNGKPYFVANDIARALGYSRPRQAIIDHCKGSIKMALPSEGGLQETNIIPEGDIYRLIVKSQLPSAERFETWVFEEVLPSIRQNGGYIANQENLTPEQIVANALLVAQKIIDSKDKLISEMKPKAEYFDDLVERNLLTNFRDTAKELHVGEKEFIGFLMDKGYVYRDRKRKLKPYAEKNNGLFELKEFASDTFGGVQTLITPKGRETFRLLLKV